MITRNIIQGCCGNSGSIVLQMDKPIMKNHVDLFIKSGYTSPIHYLNSGIFYVRKNTLVATASFGLSKINVRCGAHKREEQLTELEQLLEQAINS